MGQWADSYDDVQEICQQTAIRSWAALVRGQYREEGAFGSWLYKISRNVMHDWMRLSSHTSTCPSPDDREQRSDVQRQDTDRLTLNLLYEWLCKRLAEVLETSPGGGQPSSFTPLLQKFAFLCYYVDGYTLLELHSLRQEHCRLQRISPPTKVQLNNWLRRGDILLKFVRHLLDHHLEAVTELTTRSLQSLDVSNDARRAARLRWIEGKSYSDIASELDYTVTEVEVMVEDCRTEVVEFLTATIKENLHTFRHDS